MYTNENGAVYRKDGKMTELIGPVNKTETMRIDNTFVDDVSYTFDFDQGRYIEQSRTRREDVYAPEPTVEDLKAEIAFLKERDSRMQDDINAIIEGMTGGV